MGGPTQELYSASTKITYFGRQEKLDGHHILYSGIKDKEGNVAEEKVFGVAHTSEEADRRLVRMVIALYRENCQHGI